LPGSPRLVEARSFWRCRSLNGPVLDQMDSAPERFTEVVRADGTEKEVRVLEGHIFVCKGCCCGNVDRNFPEVPLEEFKSQWKARGIRRRVHLTISGCLGPCPLANVVLLILYGQSVWLHSVDSAAQVTAVYDYVERVLAAGAYLPLNGRLSDHEFNRCVSDACAEGRWECLSA